MYAGVSASVSNQEVKYSNVQYFFSSFSLTVVTFVASIPTSTIVKIFVLGKMDIRPTSCDILLGTRRMQMAQIIRYIS